MSIYAKRLGIRFFQPDGVRLRRWLWLSYLRTAIIPLLFVELTFLAVFWLSTAIVYREDVNVMRVVSTRYLDDVASREAANINANLERISRATSLLAKQSVRALEQGSASPPADAARYWSGPNGSIYTAFDNGGTASFYSGHQPVGASERQKMWRLGALDPLMIDMKTADPIISSIYINTSDSYNRIYPYVDVLSQYPAKMNIPSYNFYYEADQSHNPGKHQVWTDAYIDPAGHGWMVSSIAPVWRAGALDGVVGMDITLDSVIGRLLSSKLPWSAYAILVDRNGGIIAMPPRGEQDLGLRELKDHSYSSAIITDTFKPEAFNLSRRANTKRLGQALLRQDKGQVKLDLRGGGYIASFARVPGPGWSLVVIAPESAIYASANGLRVRLQSVIVIMALALVAFYAMFFLYLYIRAQGMARQIAEPVSRLSDMANAIGKGEYRQQFEPIAIYELQDLGSQMVAAGALLEEAHQRIAEQEKVLATALEAQQKLSEERRRMVLLVSHELRTPLAIIGSSAQILARKATTLSPVDVKARAGKFTNAVMRMSDILEKLTASVDGPREGAVDEAVQKQSLNEIVWNVVNGLVGFKRISLVLPVEEVLIDCAPTVVIAVRTLVDNALRYSPTTEPVTVSARWLGDTVEISVSDNGPGIPTMELDRIGERYFRGSNGTLSEGAGVGLFIARKILQPLGGQLLIKSSEAGATATIHIPARWAMLKASL